MNLLIYDIVLFIIVMNLKFVMFYTMSNTMFDIFICLYLMFAFFILPIIFMILKKIEKNEDGSYTAEANDTLWGLSQKIGKDWKDSDYSGKPEKLKIGQTIRFSKIKKLENANLHGVYKSGVCLASSIAGFAICTVTSPFLTPAGGIAAGICCSTLMDHLFKKLEYSIW